MKKVFTRYFSAFIIGMLLVSLCCSAILPNAAASSYQSKYGVSYTQLFQLYPQYLSGKSETEFTRIVMRLYDDVINGSQKNDTLAAYMYSLKNGKKIIAGEILSKLGIAKNTEEEFHVQAARAFMLELCNIEDTQMLEMVKDISKQFKPVEKFFKAEFAVWDVVDTTTLTMVLKECNSSLSAKEIESLVLENHTLLDKALKKIGTTLKYWEVIACALQLYQIENSILAELLDNLPANSTLRADLLLLYDEIQKNPVEHIAEYYMSENALKFIVPVLESLVGKEDLFGGSLANTIGNLLSYLITDIVYSGPKADAIVQSIYLSTYVSECQSVLYNMKTAFMQKKATAQQIDDYEFMYSAYRAAVLATIEKAKELTNVMAKKTGLEKAETAMITHTYDDYIDMCMQDLKVDLDAGKIAKPQAAESAGTSSVVSPSESRVSIESKFKQVQNAYPPNRGVVFDSAYENTIGSFGFARFVFSRIFDCDMPSWYFDEKCYEYGDTANVVVIGQLNGTAEVTANNTAMLLSQAKLGDVIQANGESPHTMIVVETADTGITVYECGHGGDNIIYQRTISYTSLAEAYSKFSAGSPAGITLYRAANYDTLYWDGSDVFYDDSVNFEIENGVLKKYTGHQSVIVIPEGVKKIDAYAFRDNSRLISVTMPDTVVEIGMFAFENCNNLYFVEFSDALTKIDQGAFQRCSSLSQIDISNSVTRIDAQAFLDCVNLQYVSLPSFLTYLGQSCFGNTAIAEIFIPNSLNESYAGSGAYGYKYLDTDYRIHNGPFYACDTLKKVTFEEGTTKIAKYLFAGCTGLEEITIPDTVTEIEEFAFNDCLRLRSVKMGGNETIIKEAAFEECVSLLQIDIPNSVEEISANAFSNCKNLKVVSLPSSLTYLGYSCFGNTAIEEIFIPKSLDKCFIVDSVLAYGSYYYHFDRFKYRDINYTINMGPFYACERLKKATFEEGTTQIARFLFAGCTGLEEITIPDTVTTIEQHAFSSCLRLCSVKMGGNEINIEQNAFYQCVSLPEICIPNSVKKIGNFAFANCTSLVEFVIPDGTESIGEYMFSECVSLEKAILPTNEKVIEIPRNTFANCVSLKNITIPKQIETINVYSFQNCVTLESVVFSSESSLRKILISSFEGCISLKKAIVPMGVTQIGEKAFADCSLLTKVSIPRSCKEIGKNAFSACEALTQVDIADYSIAKIDEGVFKDCAKLAKIVLPKGLLTIGKDAFKNDVALFDVTIPHSVVMIDISAFSYPAKTTIYGCLGSYTEQFAQNGKFKFVDITTPAQGLAPAKEMVSLTLERGELFYAVFDMLPENSTDIIALTASNRGVSVSGLDLQAVSSGETVITATSTSGLSCDFPVIVRAPKQLSVSAAPKKLTYTLGEAFIPEGLCLTVLYDDGNAAEVEKYWVEGFDSSSEGTKNVQLCWKAADGQIYRTAQEYTVIDTTPRLESLSVRTAPNKQIYQKAESLDTTGMVIMGTYSDGSSKEVFVYQLSGYNSLKTGVQTITVSCEDQSTTFTITVLQEKENHTVHEFGDWLPDTDEQHKRLCACGAIEYERHNTIDGRCSVCKKTIETAETPSLTTEVQPDQTMDFSSSKNDENTDFEAKKSAISPQSNYNAAIIWGVVIAFVFLISIIIVLASILVKIKKN